MIVLGWHGGLLRETEDAAAGWSTHDAAAALLVDGELVAAIEEERLNRVKHANFFPARAIRRCLAQAAIGFDRVDLIAMNFIERDREVFPCDAGLPSVDRYLEDTDKLSFSVRESICELFQREFGADVGDRLFFCNHHDAHLWSAFAASGYSEALTVSIDGSGDSLSGSVAAAGDAGLTILRRMPVAQSLGNLYSDTIRLLGYRRFDEYKAMGLAPLGDPSRYRSLFESLYELLPGGEYRLASREARWPAFYDAGLIRAARRAGAAFSDVHKDVAASLQEALERIAFHMLEHFREETGLDRLCLAGGVAHNCTLNGKLLGSGLFREIFVQPAAHDAGGALGAAIAACEARGDRSARRRMKHVALGPEIGADAEIAAELEAWSPLVEAILLADPPRSAAELLAEGEVLGWVQGRSEFGPRALGQRSIVADPRPRSNQDRINMMVKRREAFRPFAPSILEEHLAEIVEPTSGSADLSFMTYALRVRPQARSGLGAVTHVDGSARVQTVSRSSNPLYWNLIDHFRSITGVPALLNTSFNNHVEPIVDSIQDVLACLLTTGLDGLILGSWLVRKRDENVDLGRASHFVVGLPPSRKLVRGPETGGAPGFRIESTASKYFARKSITLSERAYRALHGPAPIVADFSDPREALGDAAHRELLALWSARAILLSPPPHASGPMPPRP